MRHQRGEVLAKGNSTLELATAAHCSPASRLPLQRRALQLQRLVAGSADGPAVVQLLDELVAVAMERCLEPLLLESNVLDRILSQAAAAAAASGSGPTAPVSLL